MPSARLLLDRGPKCTLPVHLPSSGERQSHAKLTTAHKRPTAELAPAAAFASAAWLCREVQGGAGEAGLAVPWHLHPTVPPLLQDPWEGKGEVGCPAHHWGAGGKTSSFMQG